MKYLFALGAAVLFFGCCEPAIYIPAAALVPTPENMQYEQPQIQTNYPIMVPCPTCQQGPNWDSARVIPMGGGFFQVRSP